MKILLATLTIISGVCSSYGIKMSDEKITYEMQKQDIMKNGGTGNFVDQEVERKLKQKKKEAMRGFEKKEYYNTNYYNMQTKRSHSKKSYSEKSYYQEETEEGKEDGVFIQTLTCPGQCLTINTSDLFPDDPYVTKEMCDNCDPKQKWRINTYKGDLVQLEHVASGQCVCVAEQSSNNALVGVCDDVIKLGPCEHYGVITDRSVFRYEGGRFSSQFCLERGFASQFSTVNDLVEEENNCIIDPEVNEPIPIYLFPTVSREGGQFVFPYNIFMVTDCLLDENKCSNDWW